MDITLTQGWDTCEANTVANLYNTAFGQKFSAAIPDKQQRIALLEKSFVPHYSFVARFNNEIVGLAGFQTPNGALTSGMTGRKILNQLGLIKGVKACLLLSLFEREAREKELVMDGIVVDSQYRSHGIGSKLLDAVITYAQQQQYTQVRLDVINTNPRAKKLYLQKGFIEGNTEHFPFLKPLLGFSAATTMLFPLNKPSD